jgi:hypothetical protein
MMGKVQKSSDSECYMPSSEPFRFYWNFTVRVFAEKREQVAMGENQKTDN